jgi:hypothetical protein
MLRGYTPVGALSMHLSWIKETTYFEHQNHMITRRTCLDNMKAPEYQCT